MPWSKKAVRKGMLGPAALATWGHRIVAAALAKGDTETAAATLDRIEKICGRWIPRPHRPRAPRKTPTATGQDGER